MILVEPPKPHHPKSKEREAISAWLAQAAVLITHCRRMDGDNNGTLDFSEMVQAMRELGALEGIPVRCSSLGHTGSIWEHIEHQSWRELATIGYTWSQTQ